MIIAHTTKVAVTYLVNKTETSYPKKAILSSKTPKSSRAHFVCFARLFPFPPLPLRRLVPSLSAFPRTHTFSVWHFFFCCCMKRTFAARFCIDSWQRARDEAKKEFLAAKAAKGSAAGGADVDKHTGVVVLGLVTATLYFSYRIFFAHESRPEHLKSRTAPFWSRSV